MLSAYLESKSSLKSNSSQIYNIVELFFDAIKTNYTWGPRAGRRQRLVYTTAVFHIWDFCFADDTLYGHGYLLIQWFRHQNLKIRFLEATPNKHWIGYTRVCESVTNFACFISWSLEKLELSFFRTIRYSLARSDYSNYQITAKMNIRFIQKIYLIYSSNEW